MLYLLTLFLSLVVEKGLNENNLTVAGLARKSSVSVSTLYRLKLYDYRFPSSKIMQKLEKVLRLISRRLLLLLMVRQRDFYLSTMNTKKLKMLLEEEYI